MRQNTSSPRGNLPFQCFHSSSAPFKDPKETILFVRGAKPSRLICHLVAFPQREPVAVKMHYTGSRSGIHRFSAPLPVDTGFNLQRYSFKISLLNPASQICDVVWYSSLGMSRETPLLQHCFAFNLNETSPAWARNLICYQILPDRFASTKEYFMVDADRYGADAPVHSDVFEFKNMDELHTGGCLDGVGSMLPYLKEMGFDGIYLAPVFKAPSTYKFDTEDYDVIDSHFGGNGALKRLRLSTKEQDMRILLHGTFNHTGDIHPWFDRQERTGKGALHHDDSPYRQFYTINDESDENIAYYKQDPTKPELDYRSKAVRYAMYDGDNAVVRKWLRMPYGIDGWVLDAASQIGDDGVAKHNVRRLTQLCMAARQTNSDALLIGQFVGDARYALNIDDSVDGSINYTGFLSPVRSFFGGVNLLGEPVPYTGEDLRRACENYAVGMAQQVKLHLFNQLDNYDLPRFYDIIGHDKYLYAAALAVLYTWRGIPCVYQGSELGDAIASYKLGPKAPLPYLAMKNHTVSAHCSSVQNTIAELAAMRRSNPALTNGSLIFICAGGAYFGYMRIYTDRFAIVLTNASRQNVKIEQGSILFPLLVSMYLPTDSINNDEGEDSGETLLIPLSGRNVRRTDHGEGLEALYELLSREKLTVSSYGFNKNTQEFAQSFIKELTEGKTLTLPARTTVVVNNSFDINPL